MSQKKLLQVLEKAETAGDAFVVHEEHVGPLTVSDLYVVRVDDGDSIPLNHVAEVRTEKGKVLYKKKKIKGKKKGKGKKKRADIFILFSYQ